MTRCLDTFTPMLIDCHTHRATPYPGGIINAAPGEALACGQLYSVGLHPADLPAEPAHALGMVAEAAADPRVVAIGECGLDSKCPTPAWLQLKAFTRQAEIAESVGKPLIIHCVKTAGEVTRLRRVIKAQVPWVVHGFRGKPTVLAMLLGCGCCVSYGEHFNPESLRLTPEESLLAETDCSPLRIEQIIEALSATRGQDLAPATARNAARLFAPPLRC